MSCGVKDIEVQKNLFVATKNASYNSSYAITDFVEAIGVRVDELQVNQLLDAPFFCLMADICMIFKL